MRAVLQRVTQASCKVDGKITVSEEKLKKGGTTIILGSNRNDSIGKNKTEIEFMWLTMMNPASSWFEMV